MEESRSAFKILISKSKGRRPLGRHRRRQEDDIRIYLKQIESIGGIELIRLRIGVIEELL